MVFILQYELRMLKSNSKEASLEVGFPSIALDYADLTLTLVLSRQAYSVILYNSYAYIGFICNKSLQIKVYLLIARSNFLTPKASLPSCLLASAVFSTSTI